MRDGLTQREAEVVAFLRAYASDKPGQSPSMVEIAAALNVKSAAGAHRIICQLARKGWVQRGEYGARRALRLIEELSVFLGKNIDGKATVLILAPTKAEATTLMGRNASALAIEPVNLASEPTVISL